MKNLKGKWALVTGASRGVGQQVAIGLAKSGTNVVIHSSSLENQKETQSLLSEYGVEVYGVYGSLEDPGAIHRFCREAEEKSGGIDFLFNNAAVMTEWTDLFETPIEDYKKSFQINVFAVIQLCNFFAPLMSKRNFGRIVNVTSGIADTPNLDAYSISKAALDKYTIDLAVELKDTQVLANMVDPGWCRTDLGGDQAPNEVSTVVPGALIPLALNDCGPDAPRGQLFRAQDYKGIDF